MPDLMPAVFVGHGNPINALARNAYTRGWAAIGKSIPRPKAVLSVSAHWYVSATSVMANRSPKTVHDFGGFPQELYEIEYPAPGCPKLARRVAALLGSASTGLDASWRLDHGTWAVLCYVFPEADVPVVQLSIDRTQPPEFHYEIGRRLAPLREEGVLLIGSGNIVHNLHAYAWGQSRGHAPMLRGKQRASPFDWAVRFETRARELVLQEDDARMVAYEKLGRDAMLSIPTPDHYLPLLYVLGARKKGQEVRFPVTGVDGGSVSMLAIQIG